MVEFALGFVLVETRSLTLNIKVPQSAFLYHLVACCLASVAVWTQWGLPVALVLIVSQQATLAYNLVWLCSRRHWRGCCHGAFLALFVLLFALARVLCYAAAAVLAWSLLLSNLLVPRVPQWLAYGMVGGLCAFFMAHAVWACQAAAGVCADLGRRSALAAHKRRQQAEQERAWIASNADEAETVPILGHSNSSSSSSINNSSGSSRRRAAGAPQV